MNNLKAFSEKVKLISLPSFEDDRGKFRKMFSMETLHNFHIRQINAVTSNKGILRGLHYQQAEAAESKLFIANKGVIQLAYLDIDEKVSRTVILDSPDQGLLIPRGFATGYLVLSDDSEVVYFSDNDYKPESESGIRWNDPILEHIVWNIESPKVSEKDQSWSDFK